MTDENSLRLVLIVVSIIQTAISVRYLRMAKAGSTIFQHREEGLLLSVGIVAFYLAFVASVLAYYFNPAWMAWSAVNAPVWLRWCGVVPLLVGGCVLVWGLHHLGTNLTIGISTGHEHNLVTSGPYRWVRHPLYSSGMIESVGLCLMMANWFVLLSAFLFWTMIVIRTPMEEQQLIATFGDEHRQYRQRVGRFLPTRQEQWLPVVQSTPGLFALSLLTYVVLTVWLFGLAGRWDLPWFWMTIVTIATSHLILIWTVFRHDPDLIRERVLPGRGEPLWDKLILTLTGLVALTNLAVGPLDVGRFHWSDTVAAPLQALGLFGIALGMALTGWAMAVNTFFSKVVRIQEDRGHVVIQSGPYRFVRHPGYVGVIVLWSSFHFAIGSWLSVAMSLLLAGALVFRTALEDRFLRKNLKGYDEYTHRVRWRLVPGVW